MKFKNNKSKSILITLSLVGILSTNVFANQVGIVNVGSSDTALKEITENKYNNINNKIESPNIKPSNETKLYINREEIKVGTINYNGTLYLPVRDIANIINKEVSYDATNKIVYLDNIELPVGYNFAIVRGSKTPINENDSNIGTIVVENKTYLPIRFILEVFGYNINYNPKTKIAEAYLMGVEGVEQGFIYSVDENQVTASDDESMSNYDEMTDEEFEEWLKENGWTDEQIKNGSGSVAEVADFELTGNQIGH